MDALFTMIKDGIIEAGSLTMPIKKIHGLSVTVEIRKRTNKPKPQEKKKATHAYTFIIKDDHYHTGDEGEEWEYYQKYYSDGLIKTDEELKIMLECCIRFIKQCKIDKLTGHFALEGVTNGCYEKNMYDFVKLAELFEDIEHVKPLLSKCCVCTEWTRTSLKDCDHNVCLDCMSKLVKKDCSGCNGYDPQHCCSECCGLQQVASCPMCRKQIIAGIYEAE
jgi:hypothetical protein